MTCLSGTELDGGGTVNKSFQDFQGFPVENQENPKFSNILPK